MKSRHVAVIYLASTARARQLAELLSAYHLDAQVVESSENLYQVLNYQPVDVVIIENKLRGFLCGFEILERVYNDLLKPGTILLASVNPENQERARRIGGTILLAPDVPVDAIRVAVEGILARAKIAQTLICAEARRLVADCGDIPAMPQLLVKLASYLHEPNVSIEDLANDISVDAKVTAELLKLGNSSAMGMNRRFTKVFDVINYLGASRTVSLIISNSVASAQARLGRNLPTRERHWYNRRSILISSTAAAFAKNFEEVSPDTAQVLGLLQEVGILLMLQGFGEHYLNALQRVRSIGHLRLEIIESERFSMTHADVSAALLQRWDFPTSLVTLIHAHHSAEKSIELSATEQRFLRSMRIGEALANLTDGHARHRFPALAQLLSPHRTVDSDRCTACLAEAVDHAANASKLLSLPVPSDEELASFLKGVTAEELLQAEVGLDQPSEHEISAEAANAATTDDETDDCASPKTRIAVLDDEPRIANIIASYLKPLGFAVDSFSNVEAFLHAVARYDAVVVDIHLGESDDGREVIHRLRGNGYHRPIVATSGDRTRETVAGCILAGATDFLAKPFEGKLVMEKMRRHVAF